MEKIKECKKINFTPVLITFVVFLRAYFLSDRRRMGLADFYPITFDFTVQGIVLISLFAVFAVLASLAVSKLGKKYGDAVSFISLFLVAEPLLFAKQENYVNLVIWIAGLIFVLNALSEKSFIPKEITLVVFLFVACILAKNAIYLFVAPAIVFYVAGDVENIAKNARKIITLIISAVSVTAGIALNNYLTDKVPAFSDAVKSYSFFQQVYFKDVEYENVFLFLFAAPVLVFGIKFFVDLYNGSKVTTSKKSGKKQSEIVSYNPNPAIVCVSAAYILSVAGFIVAGSNAFYTINYIIPAAVISMLGSGNKTAEKALEKTNGFFSKYSFVVIAVVVLLCYVSVRVFFKDVDNLATFLVRV